MLTIHEVCERLRVSRGVVMRLIHSGRLAARKIGAGLRVDEQDVQRLLDSSLVRSECDE